MRHQHLIVTAAILMIAMAASAVAEETGSSLRGEAPFPSENSAAHGQDDGRYGGEADRKR
jgi:hypothetical protein